MKLDYDILISPFPFYLPKVGNIKVPTLKEIWSPGVTYKVYNIFLYYLLLDVNTYLKMVKSEKLDWYRSFKSDDQWASMFELIEVDGELRSLYREAFKFFFKENIVWDKERSAFITVTNDDKRIGEINESNFTSVCDVILQRCGMNKNIEADVPKFKNKLASDLYAKMQNNKIVKVSEVNEDIALPNLLSAVAVKSHSINFTNIWDLTVFQLLEHFKREVANVYFDIQQMSVAAWGDEKKSFTGDEWYKKMD